MYRLLISALLLCMAVSLGCTKSQTMKDSWKYTKRQYYSYINTPATLDFDDKGSCEVYELALGDSVLHVDSRIGELGRAMDNADTNPNQEWVISMITRFPWLSGVALVDAKGSIEARYPDYFMKEFDISPLLESDPKQRTMDLRTYTQMSPLGPEVYVAKPVYMDGTLRGFVIAHFDPRQLVETSKDAANAFVLLSPYGLLWSANGLSTGGLASEDWFELLKRDSCGILGSEGSKFFWTTRYLGNMPFVYAVPITAEPSHSQTTPQPDSAPTESTVDAMTIEE